MTATELHRHLQDAAAPPVLLDVREEWEFAICHLPGSVLVPVARIPQVLDRFTPHGEIVVICHHGIRSRMVAGFLVQQGFTQVINLSGGLAAWAQEVDPDLPTY
jgi:rhodanese-related sulfurtransferase